MKITQLRFVIARENNTVEDHTLVYCMMLMCCIQIALTDFCRNTPHVVDVAAC